MLENKRLARIGIPLLFCGLFFGVQSWLGSGAEKQGLSQLSLADSDMGNFGSNASLAQVGSRVIPPNALYDKAYRLVKEGYYDQKFSGQDWSRWEHHYDGKLKTSDDAHKAIETMIASLGDPYTRFLDRDAFDDEKSQIEAHLFGVGMQLGMHDHKVVVIAPIDGTPASGAGIQPGDEITEVDKKPVKGQSLDQVVKQIRGPLNTPVSITLQRKTERKVVAFIQKNRAAVRLLKSPDALSRRAGERAFFVAEQFAFQKCFGNRGAVDFDQRPGRRANSRHV